MSEPMIVHVPPCFKSHEAWVEAASQLGNRLCVTVEGDKGIGIEATGFAEVMRQTVKVLSATAKETGKAKTKWLIIEAAIVGEHGSFTLMGVDEETINKAKAAKETI
ncbi:MAG: hypothetical protein IMZ50_08005 [Candidatus Atribacteria bacterium]|nr:hypothetical protein [Candidatus Atribacteria bacterium]